MKQSDRIHWFEQAYEAMRLDLIPEAPAGVSITIGWPSKKRQGKDLCVGECYFEVLANQPTALFGSENLITLHPIQGDNLTEQLSTLAHEMIHHALPPEVKHKKQFQTIAKRIGLCKPWTSTQPDGTLQGKLWEIQKMVTDKLGFEPSGVYIPKPPPIRKPSQKQAIRCTCSVPRTLTLPKSSLTRGTILCGVCSAPFRLVNIESEEGCAAVDSRIYSSTQILSNLSHEVERVGSCERSLLYHGLPLV